jgi:hypothetical protein
MSTLIELAAHQFQPCVSFGPLCFEIALQPFGYLPGFRQIRRQSAPISLEGGNIRAQLDQIVLELGSDFVAQLVCYMNAGLAALG